MWGRLVPRVSFSSDALGMPREFMGVYNFLRRKAGFSIRSPQKLTHQEHEYDENKAYVLTQFLHATRY